MKELRTVMRGSGVRVVGLTANTLVAIFLMPFLVHNLGDRIYGYWTLVATILGYYGLLDLGIVSAVQFHVAKAFGEKDPGAANRAVSTAFFAFAALGSFVFVITTIVAASAHAFIADPADVALFRRVLLIMGAGFAIGFPGRAFLGAISAHLRWDLIASVGIGALFLRASIIVLVIRAGWGIDSLAAVTVVFEVLTYALYYVILRRIQASFHLSFSKAKLSALKEVLHYSVFSFIIKVSDQLRFFIDVLIVSGMIGVGAVTHYSIGSRLALSSRDLLIAILGILAPWFSVLLGSADFARMRRLLSFGTKLSVSISSVITCCLVLYGKGFIHAWMGAAYLDAYWPLVLLAVSVFFAGSQLPSSSYLYGVSKHRFLAYMGLIEGAINVGLSILLAPRYGLVGVALGTIIPVTAMWLVVEPIYVCQQAHLSVKNYYINLYARPLGIMMAAIVGPWFVLFRSLLRPTVISIACLVACQVAIALLVGFRFVLSNEERALIAKILVVRVHGSEHPTAPSSEKIQASLDFKLQAVKERASHRRRQ